MSRSVLAVLAILAASGSACGHRDDGPDLVVTYEDRGATVALATGQRLSVELWNGASAGFAQWVVATTPDPAVLALVRAEHEAPRDMPGATGTDRFVFDGAGAGTTAFVATSTSPHYGETMTFQLLVVVRGAMR